MKVVTIKTTRVVITIVVGSALGPRLTHMNCSSDKSAVIVSLSP